MRGSGIPSVLLSIAVGLASTPVGAAEVVHEWDFESSEPFHDSVGKVKLNPSQGVERIEVKDGPAAARGHAIAFPGNDEAILISPSVLPLTASFEVEMDFRLLGELPRSPMTLAQQGLFLRPDLLAWALQVVPPAEASGGPARLQLLLSDGKRLEKIISTVAPEPGTDYRLTATVDLERGEVRLSLRPLDDSLPAQAFTGAIVSPALNPRAVKVFCVGDSTGRMSPFPFRGLVHRLALLRGASPP